MRQLPRPLRWLLVPSALIVVMAAQYGAVAAFAPYQQETRRLHQERAEALVPSVGFLRAVSLGNPEMMADLLWISTIQYFGGGNPYGAYPSLGKMLHTITDLDPKYRIAYVFGMIVLPFNNQTIEAVDLGEKAAKTFPEDGLLHYYLATTYQLNAKDYRKAAFYYEKAASLEGAPAAAKRMAGISLSQIDETTADRIAALEFWKTAYEEATEPSEIERAQNWYQHLEVVIFLEEQAGTFHKQFGRYPADQQELVQADLSPEVFTSPVNRSLEFNEIGRIEF